MLDQESSFYLISVNILITCLLNNVWYYWEKIHVNHLSVKYYTISISRQEWRYQYEISGERGGDTIERVSRGVDKIR